jgi:hypothetical protein
VSFTYPAALFAGKEPGWAPVLLSTARKPAPKLKSNNSLYTYVRALTAVCLRCAPLHATEQFCICSPPCYVVCRVGCAALCKSILWFLSGRSSGQRGLMLVRLAANRFFFSFSVASSFALGSQHCASCFRAAGGLCRCGQSCAGFFCRCLALDDCIQPTDTSLVAHFH